MGSGARVIELNEHIVIKVGNERVGQQGAWLTQYPGHHIVRVFGGWDRGYVMERLDPLSRQLGWNEIVQMLRRDVWSHPPRSEPDWDEILDYAEKRASEWWPEVQERLERELEWCKDQPLTRVLAHGDPTLENVMERFGEPVLIDPIPSTYHTPDLLAVDLGKILQSACGYENALVNMSVKPPAIGFLREFAWEEQRAAKAFALYHVVRLLPYLVDDAARERMKETVGANVLSL